MRIIAGEFRGRLLIEPHFDTTRPITDRAKQSLFDILSPNLPDLIVYDCFCGTGSMGLECLSRGAKHATFFDADRHALAGLKRNIDALGVQSRVTIKPGDIFRSFPPPLAGGGRGSGHRDDLSVGPLRDREELRPSTAEPLTPPSPSRGEGKEVDLLFFDPPYAFLREKPTQLIDLIGRLIDHRLAAGATVVFRHDSADALNLPRLRQVDLRTYGGMAIEILRFDIDSANESSGPV